MPPTKTACLALIAATLLSVLGAPRAADNAGGTDPGASLGADSAGGADARSSLAADNAGRTDSRAPLDRYGALLSKYVTPQGVRYAAWRAVPADVQALTRIVDELSGTDVRKLPDPERHALMINLYNAKILEIVLTKSPKKSIKEVTPGLTGYGVFLKSALRFDGKTISLHDLEDRLRDDSKDPRIHFAINCASKSCPPIASEPYRGSTLDAQLDRSTRAFLAMPGAVVVSRGGPAEKPQVTIQVSKIFDWYAKDFAASGGAAGFLGKYGSADVAAAIKGAQGKVKLDHQDYDWSLNDAV